MTQHLDLDLDLAEAEATDTGWWRDAVIYQVYPRSFADGDGDGMGDIPGIRERLPYLRDLGVDAVWLSPFYASPQADAGYDVADYRAIDPMFGTLHDADGLIRDAHRLGLRIIVDLVPNHSSDQHEWFKQALREGPGSPLRARYHFRPGKGGNGELPPNDWESVFGGPAWTRAADGEWFLHLFAPEQPDFNWEHPAVRDEFRSILRFWLDMGVDGFRIDVAHGLVKADGLPDIGDHEELKLLGNDVLPFFDQDGVHEIYRSWRLILEEYDGERIAVAEAWTPTVDRTANYLRPDELHQAFNFQYLSTGWDGQQLREVIDRSLDAMRPVGAPTTWVLSNHDVVRHLTRLGGGLRRARAASLLMLALPGSAYVYQGEELGLPEVTDLPDEVRQDPAFHRTAGQDGFRDGCRVPMPWTAQGMSYGFGPGGSWLPQPPEWELLSVEAQSGDPDSTLELYRSALALRRTHPGLGAGTAVEWTEAPAGVLAFRRPGGFACTVNTTGGTVTFRAPGAPGAPGTVLLASAPVEVTADGVVALPADTTVWRGLSDEPRIKSAFVTTARLADIAAQAGVSEATASRVMNGKAGVAAATRQKVLAALDVLGYERPLRLRTRSAGQIGLITPELSNPIFPAFAQVIEQNLTGCGYTAVLCTQHPGGATEDELVEALAERGVMGIVFLSGLHADLNSDPERYAKLVGRGVPYVLINGYNPAVAGPFVSPDDRASARMAAQHLVDLGHERIGLAVGPNRFVPVRRKVEGFTAALGEDAPVQHTLFSVEGGHAAANALLDQGCTGIVCGSDLMALGAVRAARERGLAVPRDVSVVGYDDSPLVAFTDPPLTTIRQPVEAMGAAAVNALLEEIGGNPVQRAEFVFQTELVVRGSTAQMRKRPRG